MDLNVYLALRRGAGLIEAVQPDPLLIELLSPTPGSDELSTLNLPQVHWVVAEPRHYIDHAPHLYDLVQLVELQSLAAGSVGTAGLAENHLITEEGLASCLSRLKPGGVLAACRGNQTPPRDVINLLATIVRALRKRGMGCLLKHLAIVRDYLAVCIMVSASPWTPAQIAEIRGSCDRLPLMPVWYPGIRREQLNVPDELTGPPDAPGDWYHHGTVELCSPWAEDFIDGWPFDVRPPTDDRPFFLDFFRTGAIRAMRQSYGPHWLTRVELAYLFVWAGFVATATVGAALTVVPAAQHSHESRTHGHRRLFRGHRVGIHALGNDLSVAPDLSARILRMGRGPLHGGIPRWSGLGSLAVGRMGVGVDAKLPRLMLALIAAVVVALAGITLVRWVGGAWPLLASSGLAILLLAPLCLLMGMPMPAWSGPPGKWSVAAMGVGGQRVRVGRRGVASPCLTGVHAIFLTNTCLRAVRGDF